MLGWTWILTNIGVDPIRRHYYAATGSSKFSFIAPITQKIYLHKDAASEPAGDLSITTGAFDSTEIEYHVHGAGNIIASWTSETGFFPANINFDTLETVWQVRYVAKYSGGTDGYTKYFRFNFYKRDASNNDTLLWYTDVSMSTLYSGTGVLANVYPAGSVATTDRLRITAVGNESIPG